MQLQLNNSVTIRDRCPVVRVIANIIAGVLAIILSLVATNSAFAAVSPPVYSASFTSGTLVVNQTAAATISIQNPNSQALTGISLTASGSFPAGWTGQIGAYSANCVGLSATSSTSISFTLSSLSANSVCTIYYNVIPSTTGTYAISGGTLAVAGPSAMSQTVAGPGTLTVNNSTPQTIAFTSTPPAGIVVGSAPYTVTATGGGSGNPVTFSVDAASTSGACSISGSTVSFAGAGICIVDANQPGNTSYAAAPVAEQDIAIGLGAQVISFTSTAPTNATVSGASYTVSATGGASGNAVTFSIDASSTSGACTISGSIISFTGAGTCFIDANQAGNTNYAAAAQAQQSVAVGLGAQTITFTSSAPGGATVNGASYFVSASGGASGNAVTFKIDASSTSGACSISGSNVSFTGAGTCVVDANQAGNSSYSAAVQVQQSFVVGKAAQTITFTSSAPGNAIVGGATYVVIASGGASGNAVTFSIDGASTAGACTATGSTVSFTGAGTCIVDANQASSANYSAAVQVQQTISVGKASQSISFTSSAPANGTVGGASYTVSATGGASGNAVTFSIDGSSTSGACTISGSTVSFTGSGTCVIDANQAASANYSAAVQVQQTVGIGKASQTISFTSTMPSNETVGGASYTVSATGGASGNAVTFSIDLSSTSGACTISGSTVSFTGVGACVIDANQASSANYSAAVQIQQTISVGKGSQSISFTSTAPSGPSIGASYTVTATGGGSGVAIVFAIDSSSTSGACTISGSKVSFTGAGSCIVDANEGGSSNYNAAVQVTQTIDVGKAAQTIAFVSTAPGNAAVGAVYTVVATGGASGNAVAFSIDGASTAGACTISGAAVSFAGAGTCIVDANQAGSANYAAAAQIQQSIVVGKAAQAIVFTSSAPGNAVVGGATYTVSATGGASGAAVTFTIDSASTSGACTISGSTVSFAAAGTCVVDANQAASGNYSAATQVQQAFGISKAAQTITFTSSAPSGAAVGGASYTVAATGGASGVAVTFSIDVSTTSGACAISGSTVSFTGAGTCVIDANQAGNGSYNAAAQVQQAIGVGASSQAISFTSAAPSNPLVGATYTVSATGGASGNAVTFTIDASSTSGACTISGSTVSFTGAGTCVVDANQAGNANYSAAVQIQQTIGVGKGAQTLAFTSSAPSGPAIGATYVVTATGGASGVAIVFSVDASSTSGACTISGSTVSFTGAGTCLVDANQAGSANYNAAVQVQQAISVGKASQTLVITSTAPASPLIGATYTVTATGGASGLAVTFAIDTASTSGACTISGATITFTGVGACIVDANQAGNANYAAAAQVQQAIVIGAMSQTIAFTSSPPSSPAIGATYNVSATGGASGNAVTFTIDLASTSGVCTISGSSVIFIGTGTCIVDANQAASASYTAAAQVQQMISVGKASQTITFTSTAPASPQVGATFTVTATGGGSGNAVTFTIDAASTSGACKLSGATATFLAPGSCLIDANQAGSASYLAATQAQLAIAVAKVATTVTASVSAPVIVAGAPVTISATIAAGSTATGTVTFTIGGATLGTAQVSQDVAKLTVSSLAAGTQTLTVAYSGDATYSSSTSSIALSVSGPASLRLDTNVEAVVAAQVQAGQAYMNTQIDNTFRRVEQLHDEVDDLRPGFALSDPGLRGGYTSPGDDPNFGANGRYATASPSSADGTYLPTRKVPSSTSQAVGSLSSTFPSAIAALDARGVLPFHIWASGSLQYGTQQANGAYSNRFSTAGLTIGADGALFRNFKGGLALGVGFGDTDVGTDGSSVASNSFNATAYGSYKFARNSFIDMFAGIGKVNLDASRWSSQGNVMLSGNRSGTEAYGSLALTHDFVMGGVKASPYGRLDVTDLMLDGYTETGSSVWALGYQSLNVASVSGVLGTKISWRQAMQWGVLTPMARLEYRHDFTGGFDQSVYYASGAGAGASDVSGVATAADAYKVGLGLDAALASGAGLSLEYNFTGSTISREQELRLMARQAF